MFQSPVKILRTSFVHHDFRALTEELDQDLSRRYGKEQEAYNVYNKIQHIDTVVIAYDNGKAIGCGCFKAYNDETAEVKRMYVRPSHRGKGISKIILKELEQWASEMRFEKCILETGNAQPEAMGLYSKLGYQIIENFGQYKYMKASVCFQKRLRMI